jgi:hypothetical protein
MSTSLSPRSLRPSVQDSKAQVSTMLDELILWLSYCFGRWSRSDRRYFEQKEAKVAKLRSQHIMSNSLSPRSSRPSVQNSKAQVSTMLDELILWCRCELNRSKQRQQSLKQGIQVMGIVLF